MSVVGGILLSADLIVGLVIVSYSAWHVLRDEVRWAPRWSHPRRWARERASRRRRARMKAAGAAARLALIDRNAHRAETRKRERDEWDEAMLRAKGIRKPPQPESILLRQVAPHPDMYRVHPTQGRKHEPVGREPIYVTAPIWEAMTPGMQRRYVEDHLRRRGWKG